MQAFARAFSPMKRCWKNIRQHHGKIRYTQIAPTSRGDVQAYQDIRHQLKMKLDELMVNTGN
ncbi:hypothetical protein ACLB1E_19540 [Escherichia coli]